MTICGGLAAQLPIAAEGCQLKQISTAHAAPHSCPALFNTGHQRRPAMGTAPLQVVNKPRRWFGTVKRCPNAQMCEHATRSPHASAPGMPWHAVHGQRKAPVAQLLSSGAQFGEHAWALHKRQLDIVTVLLTSLPVFNAGVPSQSQVVAALVCERQMLHDAEGADAAHTALHQPLRDLLQAHLS